MICYQARNATGFSLGAKDTRSRLKPYADQPRAYYTGYKAQLEQDRINGSDKK